MAKGLNCFLPLRTHNLWGNMTNNNSNEYTPEWNNLAPVIYTDRIPCTDWYSTCPIETVLVEV